MAKYVLNSEGRDTMRAALRNVPKTSFLQSSREMLLVSASNPLECYYSSKRRMASTSCVVAEQRNIPETSEYFF